MEREICWNITARCNQQCLYCHRFLNIKDLSFDENFSILSKLKNYGINSITWTGGEALLLEGIDELLEISSRLGIKNKLITNGKLLNEDRMKIILPLLDSLTLSIDSVNDDINDKLGRGVNHFKEIKHILDYIKENRIDVKTRINSVVCKYNINNFQDLNNFLENYNIYSWRIFKFMPLRETAVINKEYFTVSKDDYNKAIEHMKKNSKIMNIETRTEKDMENKYILILADGNIVITKDGKDQVIGNALFDDLEKCIGYGRVHR